MGTTLGRTQHTARSLVDRSSANYPSLLWGKSKG